MDCQDLKNAKYADKWWLGEMKLWSGVCKLGQADKPQAKKSNYGSEGSK